MLRRSMLTVVAVGLMVSGCDYIPASWLKKITGTTTVSTGSLSNNSFNGIVQAEFIVPSEARRQLP